MSSSSTLQQPVPISGAKYFMTSPFSPEVYDEEEEDDIIDSLAMEDFRNVMYSCPLGERSDETTYQRSSNPLICNRFFSADNAHVLL